MVLTSETGFVSLANVIEMLKEMEDAGEHLSWLHGHPSRVLDKLLRYLPVIHLEFDQSSPNGTMKASVLAARPPNGSQFLHLLEAMAAQADHAANDTTNKLRAAPVKQYLRAMDTERDRRIFKGVVAQLTSDSFVRSAFNWHKSSIADIKGELDLVEFYMSDLNKLFNSVQYHCTE
jgi:hypothetical protein